MREIPLTQGQVALVDDEDFEWLNQWKWHAWWNNNNKSWYARGWQAGKIIRLHRLIMGCAKGDGAIVDHINHNTLDNRRSNLRICTTSQNMMNRKKKFTGAHFNKRAKRWQAQIAKGCKRIHLGYFDSYDEAVAARIAAERKYWGEFAPTR